MEDIRHFTCTSAAVVGATLFTHPIDTVKVRMQVQSRTAACATRVASHFSPVELAATGYRLAQSEGARAFTAGMGPSLVRAAIYGGLRLWLNVPLKRDLGMSPLPASLAAGLLAAIAGHPLELLKVRLQAVHRAQSGSPMEAVRSTWSSSGARGFFKGLGPASTRAMLLTATQVVPYDWVKKQLLAASQEKSPVPRAPAREPLWVHLVASLAAGLVTTTVTSPVDVFKTRLMAAAPGTHWRTVLGELAKEGPSAAWKGWLATYVRIGPQTVLIFVFMEQAMKHFS